jgi:hypothetical protein
LFTVSMSLSDLVSELNQQLESFEMDHQNIIQVTTMQNHYYYIIYIYKYIYIYISLYKLYIYIHIYVYSVCVYTSVYIYIDRSTQIYI